MKRIQNNMHWINYSARLCTDRVSILFLVQKNLGIVVGVLGQYVATLNVPANTSDFPFTELNDLGHAIVIESGHAKRISYRGLAKMAFERMPTTNWPMQEASDTLSKFIHNVKSAQGFKRLGAPYRLAWMVVHGSSVALEALGVANRLHFPLDRLSRILPSVWRSQLPFASIRCWQASMCCHTWSPFGTLGMLNQWGRIVWI